MRILPRKGRIACEARSRACLAEPPAESPSTIKSSEPCAEVFVQSASLPGRRNLRTADLRATSFSARRRRRSSARSTDQSSSLVAWLGEAASQWSKASRMVFSTILAASTGLQPPLVLALEFRLANEHRNQRGAGRHHVVGGQRARALGLADAVGMVFQRPQQRGAQARSRGCRRPASGWCCNRNGRSRPRPPSRRSPIRANHGRRAW